MSLVIAPIITPTLSGATRLRVFGAGRIITLRRAPPSRSSSPNGSWAAFVGPVPGNGDWRAYGPGAAATPDGGRKCDPSPDLNTHTHTDTHTHTHKLGRIHTCASTHTRPYSHTRTHTRIHTTRTHPHTHTHSNSHRNSHTAHRTPYTAHTAHATHQHHLMQSR